MERVASALSYSVPTDPGRTLEDSVFKDCTLQKGFCFILYFTSVIELSSFTNSHKGT